MKNNFYKSIVGFVCALFLFSCTADDQVVLTDASGIFVIKKDNKFGLMNADGSIVLEPKYEFIYSDQEYVSLRYIDSSKVGFLNHVGEVVVPAQFVSATPISNGTSIVRTDSSAYSIDIKGKKLSNEYKQIYIDVESQIGIFFSEGQWGFVDRGGREITPAQYDQVLNFSDERAAVRKGDAWGYINEDGKEIIPLQFKVRPDRQSPISSFKGGFARIREGGTCYYMNKEGERISDNFSNCGDFIEGKAQISRGNKWGFVDSEGKASLDSTYQWTSYYQEGFAQYKTLNRVGYLNSQGEVAIKAAYTRATHFTNGVARVQLMEDNFYIDTKGKKLDFPQGITIKDFDKEGFAIFVDEATNTFGIINRKGNIVLPAHYTSILPYKNGLAAIFENGMGTSKDALQDPVLELGYVDRNGNIIRKPTK